MNPEAVTHLISQTLIASFWLCAPLLAIGLAVGMVVNIIQVATSLQDASFSTIPRLAAFLVGFILLMPWMLKKMMSFTITLLGDLTPYVR